MQQVSNPFQAVLEIFYRPKQVFNTLDQANNWSWVPFFIVSVMVILPSYLYWGTLDIEWYRPYIYEMLSKDMSPSVAQGAADQVDAASYQMGSFFAPIMVIIVNAIMAVYLMAVTKIDEENLNGFTDWFGFLWWAALPVALGSLASLVVIAMDSTQQLFPHEIAPTSLAYLAGLSHDNEWLGLATSIKLESLWGIYLTAVGITQWTKIKTGAAWAIAAAPSVLIFGLWAIFKLV